MAIFQAGFLNIHVQAHTHTVYNAAFLVANTKLFYYVEVVLLFYEITRKKQGT